MRVNASAGQEARDCPFFPWLSAYLILLSAIQVSVLGASQASLRLTRPVAAAILAVSLLAAWFVWRRLKPGVAPEQPGAAIFEHRWRWRIAAAFVVLYAFLFACAAIVADPSWDGNTYHLPTIQEWFQEGRVAWVEGLESTTLPYMNGYPKTAEVISLFLCTLLHPALSNALNLIYLPLGMLGIASLARSFGATRGAALAAAAALLLVPVNMGQSLTTYVDSAFGSAVIAWIAVMVRLRRLESKTFAVQSLVLGCALGQVIGTKGTGLPLVAMGSLALVGLHLGARSQWPSAGALAVWWLGVGMCALPVGGFWYVRSIVHGHSPIYPVGLSVAGVTLFPGLDAYAPAGAYAVNGFIAAWPTPVQVAFTWMQGLWYWPRSIVGFDMRLGGLGFLWPLGCLPAIFVLARRRIQVKTTWRDELSSQPFWLVLAIVSAGIVLVPCPWWSRFTVWVYALGLPCLAVVSTWPMGRWGRRWIAACVALALVEGVIVVVRWQVPLLGVALRDDQRPPSIRIPTHFFPPWALRGKIVEQIARGHDTVGIGRLEWYQEPLVGVVSEPVGARQIYFVPDDLENEFGAWYERVRPRYVMMRERDLPPSVSRLNPQVHRWGTLMVLQFW